MMQMWQSEDGSYVSVSETGPQQSVLEDERKIKLWSGLIVGLLPAEEFDINEFFPYLKGQALATTLDIPNNRTHFVGLGKLFVEWEKESEKEASPSN